MFCAVCFRFFLDEPWITPDYIYRWWESLWVYLQRKFSSGRDPVKKIWTTYVNFSSNDYSKNRTPSTLTYDSFTLTILFGWLCNFIVSNISVEFYFDLSVETFFLNIFFRLHLKFDFDDFAKCVCSFCVNICFVSFPLWFHHLLA